MIRRHQGAREGDAPNGAEGNEAVSARLMEQEMRQINQRVGQEIFTEEEIQTAVWGVHATYPVVDLGRDFQGASFEEYHFYETAMCQNPALREVFGELKQKGATKGPHFFQPHLEKALEEGQQVPREVLLVALADLGGPGFGEPEEFTRTGNAEMRELYSSPMETKRRTESTAKRH